MTNVAVVVLSCSKPQYVQRREGQKETYVHLQRGGADVFILQHGAEYAIEKNNDFTKTLFVPVPEDYEYIPLRLWSAYQFLAESGYTHILKIDDDIQIVTPVDCSQVFTFLKEYDYAAIKGIGGREIKEKEGVIIMNTYHWSKCGHPLLNRTYSVFPSVEYASGPCYWISTAAVKQWKKSDFEKCIFEDVCVGIACKKNAIPLFNAVDMLQGVFRGEGSHWAYVQYITKNHSMYYDMINS